MHIYTYETKGLIQYSTSNFSTPAMFDEALAEFEGAWFFFCVRLSLQSFEIGGKLRLLGIQAIMEYPFSKYML